MSWSWDRIDWGETAAVIAAAGTVVQAAVALIMLKSLRLAAAATNAANAAVATQQEIGRHQLQAYVSLGITHLKDAPDGGLIARGEIHNAGQTPALNLRGEYYLNVCPLAAVSDLDDPPMENDAFYTLRPGASGLVAAHLPSEAAQASHSSRLSGHCVVVLIVRVEYEDVFGCAHVIRARRYFSIPEQDPSDDAGRMRAVPGLRDS